MLRVQYPQCQNARHFFCFKFPFLSHLPVESVLGADGLWARHHPRVVDQVVQLLLRVVEGLCACADRGQRGEVQSAHLDGGRRVLALDVVSGGLGLVL